MRISGIKAIAWCPADSVPETMELEVMAGIKPSIVGIQFTALSVLDGAQLDLIDSNENNGSNQKATLSFVTETEFKSKRAAFIVVCNNGAKYLIGSKVAVPAISTKDITAGPSAANNFSVTVELSAPVAWALIEGQEATTDGQFIMFEFWEPKADSKYAPLVHRHDADEVDDENYDGGMTQDEINQDLADLAAAGIVL